MDRACGTWPAPGPGTRGGDGNPVCGGGRPGTGARRRDRGIDGAGRGALGAARGDPPGQPQDRRGVEPRHQPAPVGHSGLHRPRAGGIGGPGAVPHQLLWASGRRQPALERVSRAGADARRP